MFAGYERETHGRIHIKAVRSIASWQIDIARDLFAFRIDERELIATWRGRNNRMLHWIVECVADLATQVDSIGALIRLTRLRDDTRSVQQDCRVLYLAWLKAISMHSLNQSEREPPVPPGLRSLSSALRNFVDLFEVDKHLVAVAAKVSAEPSHLSASDLRQAISHLSRGECEEYLLRLAQ